MYVHKTFSICWLCPLCSVLFIALLQMVLTHSRASVSTAREYYSPFIQSGNLSVLQNLFFSTSPQSSGVQEIRGVLGWESDNESSVIG